MRSARRTGAEGTRGDLGLLPDAEPCASDRCAEGQASLGRAIGEAHRRYTNFINARGRWSGHLFQSRFASVAMDEAHLTAAVRYVSLNPVRAQLVPRAEDWPWSSVRAHLAGVDDSLAQVKPVLERVHDFAALLASGTTMTSGLPPFAAPKEWDGRLAMRISLPIWSGGLGAQLRAARRDANLH